jgi:hypothetical protein
VPVHASPSLRLRSAAFVLGGMMLVVGILMLGLNTEAANAFAFAMLTEGPIAAVRPIKRSSDLLATARPAALEALRS